MEKAIGDVSYFETSDENKCNWMMFVRPAESYAEQNMVVFQYGQDLYFTVTKVIEAKMELKVQIKLLKQSYCSKPKEECCTVQFKIPGFFYSGHKNAKKVSCKIFVLWKHC